MKSFKTFFSEARTPRLAPGQLDTETNQRLQNLISKINEYLKYGVSKYPHLVDSRGQEAFGLDDSVLQDRKLRYLYLYLSQGNYGEGDVIQQLKDSNSEMGNYLRELNLWKSTPSTKMKVTTAIINKVKDDPHWFSSRDFQEELLDPTNLANFMNAVRVKEHRTSKAAAQNREQAYGMNVTNIDAIKSATRDSDTKINRRAFHDSRMKKNQTPMTRSLPSS
jgi:hypothetical protein